MLLSSKSVLHLFMSAMLAGSIGLETGVNVSAETAVESVTFPAIKSPEAESGLSYQADKENNVIHWTLTFKKTADPAVLRQMQFKLTDVNDQPAMVDFGAEDQKLESLKDDWIGISDYTNTADEAVIHFQTQLPKDVENYKLKLWPRLSEQQSGEPEKTMRVGDLENYLYSVDFPKKTTGSTVEISTESQTESPAESTTSTESSGSVKETGTRSSETTQTTEDSKTAEVSGTETKESSIKTEKQKAAALPRTPRAVIPQSLTGAGLSSIPFGAKKLTGVFAEVNQNTGKGSGAIKAQNPTDGTNDNRPYDMVELSGSKNWLSIWSNESSKLNFNSNFKGRVYIKFDKTNSDGLAFVMHNDARKTAAITQAQRSSDGQNLGVYGTDNGRDNGPEKEAIKSSVAVEFDMKASLSNNQTLGDGTGGHAFDIKTGVTDSDAAHMAYSFPGLSLSYVPLKNNGSDTGDWKDFLGTVRNARIRHYIAPGVEGVQSLSGVSSGWYEFRFNYTVGAGMTYYLVNPANGTQTTPVTISDSELHSNLGLAINNNQAYWGFTAANGDAQGTSDFVFTETPVDAQFDLVNDVKDTNKQSVQSEKNSALAGKYITSGSPADFETVFNLKETERPFSVTKWTAKIDPAYYNMPANGRVKVSYTIDSGVSQETEASIDANGNLVLSLNGVTINKGQKVTFAAELPTKKGSGNHQTSFYSQLTGKYGTDTTETNAESSSVYFWIKNGPVPPLIKRLETNSGNGFTDFVDTFGLQFDYEDLDAASNELVYEIMINGKSAGKGTLANAVANNQQWLDAEKIDLLKNGLYHRGENTVTLKITDASGLSDEQTITFNVAGYKGFEVVTENYDWSFDKKALPDNAAPQNRLQDMTIKGRDTTGDNSTAKITASATDIVNEKGTVISKDKFVFKDSGTEQPLANQRLSLNEVHHYSSAEGLLLSLSDEDDTGQYKGTITWTISDAP